MVHDVNETIDYYVEILGFKFAMGVDDKKETRIGKYKGKHLVWAIVKKNDIEIMLQEKNSLYEEVPEFINRTVGGTFTLYIHMTDTQGYYQQIKDKVEIVKPIHKTFYGTYEFAIRDLNGYVLYFAQLQESE